MVQGRSAQLQQLYELEIGECIALHPADGLSLDAFAKRLRQVTTLYLREGKAYRLKMEADHVRAVRVAIGSHHKLSYLTDLKTGERWFAGASLEWKDRKALLARLNRLNVSGRGQWYAEVDVDGIYVRRWYTPPSEFWNDDGSLPVPRPLDLRR